MFQNSTELLITDEHEDRHDYKVFFTILSLRQKELYNNKSFFGIYKI